MISIIIPVYNVELYLHKCVDSVLAQTYDNFEVLLIDDGSTDSSGEICDKYATRDHRVRVFHKPNGGVSSARNIGLKNAKGEWVTFIDSDDYVFPDWLENYNIDNSDGAQLIQQGAEADRAEFIYHDRPSSRCGFDYYGSPVDYILNLFDSRMTGYSWIKAYKTDIIKENNLHFDERIRLNEDEIFLFRYLSFVSVVKSFDRQGYFYYVPDWENKYSISRNEEIIFKNAYCEAILDLINIHGYKHRLAFYFNSMIDEQMKLFAFSPKKDYFRRIRNLIRISYEDCKLFAPLKWLINNDRTAILSYPALLTHSSLRRLLNK